MDPKWLSLHRAIPGNPDIALENLTVNFHVGGSRTSLEESSVSPEEAKRELKALISSIIDLTPPQHVARLFRCGKISQPVITLLSANASVGAVHAFESKAQARRTLVIDPEFASSSPVSVAALVECLFRELGADLCAGRFSYSKGKYRPFTQREKQFIADSIEA